MKDDIKTKNNLLIDFPLFVINFFVIVFSIIGVFSYLMPSLLLSIICSFIIPLLFVANIILLVIKSYQRRYFSAFLNVVCAVFIGSIIFSFSPLKNIFNSGNNETNKQSSINVASYNVCAFNRYNIHEESAMDIAFWVQEHEPELDVIAFQEYSICKNDDNFYNHFSREYNIATSLTPTTRGISDGLAIMTKYPILNTKRFNTEDSVTYMMYCDLKIESDTIRVFNAHLQSTFINQNIKGIASSTSMANKKIINLAVSLLENSKIRHHQADSIAHTIAASPYKVLVCGDINDTPTSYTYNRIKGELKDSFYEAGFGYSNTYFGYYKTQRIDNIFASQSFKLSDYHSPSVIHSDHKPVVVKINF